MMDALDSGCGTISKTNRIIGIFIFDFKLKLFIKFVY